MNLPEVRPWPYLILYIWRDDGERDDEGGNIQDGEIR